MGLLRTRWLSVVTVLMAAAVVRAEEVPARATRLLLWEGASHVQILDPGLVKAFNLKLTRDFAVRSGSEVILRTVGGNLFNLQSRAFLPAEKPLKVTSFAVSENLIVTLRDNQLGWYQAGKIEERIKIPLKNPRVVAGEGQRLFVYGDDGNGSTVYALDQGRVHRLFSIPQGKISTLTSIGKRIFFGVNNTIYTATEGEPVGLLFVAAGQKRVSSVTTDSRAGLLYFVAGDAVYAMRAGLAVPIVAGITGSLVYADRSLFILDAGRRRMVKVTGLDKLTAPTKNSRSQSAGPRGGFKE